MEYPTELADELHILGLRDHLGIEGNGAVDELAEHGFVAATGLTRQQVGALAIMGRQPHIAEYCASDATRFGSVFLAEKTWQVKGRGFVGIYTVAGNENQAMSSRERDRLDEDDLRLVAYGWSGPQPNGHVSGADVTTAYRVSQEGRELARQKNGLKLGLPLGRLVVATAIYKHGAEPEQISLETWQSNRAAIRLYDQLGFAVRQTLGDRRPTRLTAEELRQQEVMYGREAKGQLYVPDARVHMQYAPEETAANAETA